MCVQACADGPKDNQPDSVRRVPPLGMEVSQEDKEKFQSKLSILKQKIEVLSKNPKKETSEYNLQLSRQYRIADLLPDVSVYYRAIDEALTYQEFYKANEIKQAYKLLEIGTKRADDLLAGKAPWLHETGLVVRGFVSKLDNTVQPYGLVIPKTYRSDVARPVRCDLWFHGRGERSSEQNFLGQRTNSAGRFTPYDTIVLHPYGRYSNAFKLAGEVDVLEALEHAKNNYFIDEDRTSVRGFSMGGAGAWNFAVHYSDMFFAANPGAGFSETPEFLDVFQGEKLNPTWYERKLWNMYNCNYYVLNLTNIPTIAYSGEIDRQKQAADVMVRDGGNVR